MAAKDVICGIDLGTTNSLVAYVDDFGKPLSIPSFTGHVMTPSMVYLDGSEAIIGGQAQRAALDQPSKFAECFKRYMGEDRFPNPVDGQDLRPELLSALVLRRLKAEAQRHLGQARRAVITVPAYFDECRRRATKNAGRMAGWEVVDLLNEPTAAAIAYAYNAGQLGKQKDGRERVLVYDLGGGTFDTTVLEITAGREYRALATEGEVQLGGQDWDEWLCKHLADQFTKATGVQPLDRPQGYVEFIALARKAKHALSTRKSATLPARFLGKSAVLEITQELFERGTAHLLRRTRSTTETVLKDAGMGWSDIDRVLITGGSTRMPMVAKMLRELTGKEPDQNLSPDEAVAHGASIYAHLLQTPDGPKVVNVNSHTYRLACVNREGKKVAHPLIPKNSPLPKENALKIPLRKAGAQKFSVQILEGESEDPELCYPVGTVHVKGLPADESKRWVVRIALRCVQDGKIVAGASVHDPANPKLVVKAAEATLEPQHGMTPPQVETAARFVEALKINAAGG